MKTCGAFVAVVITRTYAKPAAPGPHMYCLAGQVTILTATTGRWNYQEKGCGKELFR